jgi:hypothetical protein
MIPPFDGAGVLPPGVHPATLDDIRQRFGSTSELRRVQMQSVEWMIALARRAGVSKVILNGSFTTDIMEPNDVDCVLLLEPGKLLDRSAIRELRLGLPFLSILLLRQARFDELVRFFDTDRLGRRKGMIQVIP